jgi:hypothetical protein
MVLVAPLQASATRLRDGGVREELATAIGSGNTASFIFWVPQSGSEPTLPRFDVIIRKKLGAACQTAPCGTKYWSVTAAPKTRGVLLIQRPLLLRRQTSSKWSDGGYRLRANSGHRSASGRLLRNEERLRRLARRRWPRSLRAGEGNSPTGQLRGPMFVQ